MLILFVIDFFFSVYASFCLLSLLSILLGYLFSLFLFFLFFRPPQCLVHLPPPPTPFMTQTMRLFIIYFSFLYLHSHSLRPSTSHPQPRPALSLALTPLYTPHVNGPMQSPKCALRPVVHTTGPPPPVVVATPFSTLLPPPISGPRTDVPSAYNPRPLGRSIARHPPSCQFKLLSNCKLQPNPPQRYFLSCSCYSLILSSQLSC